VAKKRKKRENWLDRYRGRRIKVKVSLALDYLMDDAESRFYRREPGLITKDLILKAVSEKYPKTKDKNIRNLVAEITDAVKRSFKKAADQPVISGADGKPLPADLMPIQLVRTRDQFEVSKPAVEMLKDAFESWEADAMLSSWIKTLLAHLEDVLKPAPEPSNGAEKPDPVSVAKA